MMDCPKCGAKSKVVYVKMTALGFIGKENPNEETYVYLCKNKHYFSVKNNIASEVEDNERVS